MLNRSSKNIPDDDKPTKADRRPRDPNQLAVNVVREATDEDEKFEPTEKKKNPHAVALGRLGGKKGGKARAEALSEEDRRRIARKAAKVRWGKTDG